MAATPASKSAAVRARLNHPVIDSDGHMVEFFPAVLDYLEQTGGTKVVERFKTGALGGGVFGPWYRLSPEERREWRATRPPWWALPTKNTLDRATALFPKLLYERLDEIGIDFTVLYPTIGLFPPHFEDEELRRAGCRAFNMFHADLLHDYADRIMPVAIIPMHTPQEALAELEYAVQQLGMRAIMMAGHVRRPIPALAEIAPQANRASGWFDTFGLDSAYDYDPVWAKCVELKVAPTFHSGGIGWGSRRSISNFMYNHIGHFAAAGEAVCKALFMGGVTRRFPTLRCAFLEGGVGWACNLYADLIGHWQKRNPQGLENYNPANLNREQLADLYWRYGGKLATERYAQMARSGTPPGGPEDGVDEWAACHITRAEDIRDLFIPHFYFGCEADDPMNAWAFSTKVNPFGARLKAIFSSDIGHWDVPDMTKVVEEAHELVDKGVLSAEDFRDFVFTNPVTLWTALNPDFFKGTVVEGAVETLIKQGKESRV